MNDFKSMRLKVVLWNKTTKTEIKDGERSFGASLSAEQDGDAGDEHFNMSILINEFLPDGMVLELPSRSCATGHSINLEIIPENAPEKYKEFVFKGSAKVSETKKISDARDKLSELKGWLEEGKDPKQMLVARKNKNLDKARYTLINLASDWKETLSEDKLKVGTIDNYINVLDN